MGYSKDRPLKFKKRFENSICFAFHLYTDFIIICTLHAKFQKKHAREAAGWWCKIGIKWPICPNQQEGPLLEISYIPLLYVMTLHYHRIYQVSSLEANLSSEDMK